MNVKATGNQGPQGEKGDTGEKGLAIAATAIGGTALASNVALIGYAILKKRKQRG